MDPNLKFSARLQRSLRLRGDETSNTLTAEGTEEFAEVAEENASSVGAECL